MFKPSVTKRFLAALALLMVALVNAHAAPTQDAAAIVKAAIEYWRDVSSVAVFDMNIHRPDWQRGMTMKVWTRGNKESLVRVIAPAKDAGNGTLLLDNDMWSYNPKINRVIKIPSSMMNQSWMGSDFSNNDLAKADDLIDQYRHRLLATETHDGHKLYVIESVPNETAPVVWGREVLKIRDDHILMEHAFYDQADVLVKRLVTVELKRMGGKTVAAREKMQKVDKPDEWTEIVTREAQFGMKLPESTFTLGNLRNPRE
ncbi:MAG: outer membrane lipoprotein-sorting protein [Candidatus Muproteobacteria bacterium RBG_16_64_11]|uniref:Outer membrane lipoprotein-sorting protein n=1 Tax=Candidatus Muproteobacteria bacterium RBG_16_64_11 TaxID=1817758 RepID=A0A1F6TII4_9PROT|nr:MAG: outer membrane lipoprotein-sorting protein [Candidatus Muproteobacteria bacterium RBG_16_64_11]